MKEIKAATKSVHKKSHVCDICKKSFVNKSSLTRHMLVHYGKKDFQCDTCSKNFALKSVLIRRERVRKARVTL